jgi:hypothetical protein
VLEHERTPEQSERQYENPDACCDSTSPAHPSRNHFDKERYMIRYVTVVVLCVLSVSTPAQTSPSASPPQYSSGPVTDYNAALPNSSDVLRFRRGERYNVPNSQGMPVLGEGSDSVGLVKGMAAYYHDPLPFDHSDAVVVGSITSGQAYLSNDQRNIYSEFGLVVQDVLKDSGTRHIQAGDKIDIERQGGAIRLPSGKVLVRGLQDYSMPLVGKRYLLFLKYDQSAEDFHIVTGHQLEGRHTYNLDELGYSPSDRHHETLVHPLGEQGESEEQLLNRAKAKLLPNKEGK